jgi:hypothetical protein
MAYVDPTATDVKTRYPEFDSVADPRVDLFIAEAKMWVDESWLEGDYTIAIQTLTAHMMAYEGAIFSTPGAASFGSVSGPIKGEKLGDASIEYSDRGASSSVSLDEREFASTPYGLRFLALRRRNFPAVAWT